MAVIFFCPTFFSYWYQEQSFWVLCKTLFQMLHKLKARNQLVHTLGLGLLTGMIGKLDNWLRFLMLTGQKAGMLQHIRPQAWKPSFCQAWSEKHFSHCYQGCSPLLPFHRINVIQTVVQLTIAQNLTKLLTFTNKSKQANNLLLPPQKKNQQQTNKNHTHQQIMSNHMTHDPFN